jgi:hypothetical protein
MSKTVVNGLAKNCEHGFNFLFQQIDAATDEVWGKKAGGYLYWQQIYHAFSAMDVFLSSDGEPRSEENPPIDRDFASLHKIADFSPDKETVRAFGERKKALFDRWVETLTDDALAAKQKKCSDLFGTDMSNASVLSLVHGHNLYHVGCCDAILRDNGHKGVF